MSILSQRLTQEGKGDVVEKLAALWGGSS